MIEFYRVVIERPIFNLLEVIYGLIPGHDLGLSIIIFTALIRFAMWPLVKKQLNHSQKMKKLAPELKKIKKQAAGDRQQEARLQMEFYKEHEIKPFSTIGTLIVQIPVFIGLYQSVIKLIHDPNILQTYAYPWVKNLPWIQDLAKNPQDFHATFFGMVDLAHKGITPGQNLYIPALILALLAGAMQYVQSKHLLSDQKDSRKLSEILKAAANGEQADQAEMTAAVSKSMLIFMPLMTAIFSLNLPSALSLYFITSSTVGYLQQRKIFAEDQDVMQKIADKPLKKSTKNNLPTKQSVEPTENVKHLKTSDPNITVTVTRSSSTKTNTNSPTKKSKKRRR